MSDTPVGEGWWQASDGKWYPPNMTPGSLPPPAPQYTTTPPASERPTATGGFVCAVLGLVIGIIPLLFFISLPLGLIGLVLGIVGWRRKPERAKLARAATITGAAAMVMGVVGFVIVADVFDDIDNELERLDTELDEGPVAEADTGGDGPVVDEAQPLFPATIETCTAAEIAGIVTNESTETVDIFVTVAMFDDAGVRVGDAEDLVEALPPGGSARFVPYLVTDTAPFTSCEVLMVEQMSFG